MSPTMTNFTAETPSNSLNTEFDYFLELREDVSSVYFATPTKQTIIRPVVDLGNDFDPTTREWYTLAVANPDEVQWTTPYIDEATNNFVVTLSKAVQKNGQLVGVLALDVQLQNLSSKVIASDVGYNGYITLLDEEGVVLAHPVIQGENWMNFDFVASMYEQGKTSGIERYSYEKMIILTFILLFQISTGRFMPFIIKKILMP